jgi:hypothetical protein
VTGVQTCALPISSWNEAEIDLDISTLDKNDQYLVRWTISGDGPVSLIGATLSPFPIESTPTGTRLANSASFVDLGILTGEEYGFDILLVNDLLLNPYRIEQERKGSILNFPEFGGTTSREFTLYSGEHRLGGKDLKLFGRGKMSTIVSSYCDIRVLIEGGASGSIRIDNTATLSDVEDGWEISLIEDVPIGVKGVNVFAKFVGAGDVYSLSLIEV